MYWLSHLTTLPVELRMTYQKDTADGRSVIEMRKSSTNAHTDTWICGLRGLSIGEKVFILYKLYFLLAYTNPTPKLSPHRKLLPIFEFHKTQFCMFFKPFVLRGHRKCPHKPCLCCSTHVIIHLCPRKPYGNFRCKSAILNILLKLVFLSGSNVYGQLCHLNGNEKNLFIAIKEKWLILHTRGRTSELFIYTSTHTHTHTHTHTKCQ